jgi:hypothetical protein
MPLAFLPGKVPGQYWQRYTLRMYSDESEVAHTTSNEREGNGTSLVSVLITVQNGRFFGIR